MQLNKIFRELKRRNVFRVATAYAVTAWLIMQIAVSVFPYLGIADYWITVTIVVLLIGFPLSMIAGWVYELTPDGIKKTDEVDLTPEQESASDQKLNLVIITFLSLALLFLMVERIFFADSALIERDGLEVQTASIAVLPFVDMSQNQDQEYFSDGLSEELLNVLAKEKQLKVAGRTSSFKFKGQNENLTLIAEELNVRHVLEGSVRKSGNTLRITAQLIEASNGYHLWSETYDREYTAQNIFIIQDEISRQVLNELKVRLLVDADTLTVEHNMPTVSTEAYEYYLKGMDLMRDRNPDEIEQAIEEFNKAIEADKSFAECYAYLSFAYGRLYEYGSIEKDEAIDRIRTYADQALFIKSDLPHAYLGLSDYYSFKNDTLNAISAAKKAYELSPNDAEVINSYSATLRNVSLRESDTGQSGSDSLTFKAYDLDPLNPVIAYNAAHAYWRKDEFDKSIELLDRNIEANPDYHKSYTLKIRMLFWEPFGRQDEAFIQAYKGYQANPEKLDFIQTLHDPAYVLDFYSLARHLNNEVIRLFPENNAAAKSRRILAMDSIRILYSQRRFKDEIAFGVEKGLYPPYYADERSNVLNDFILGDELKKGNYKKAYTLIKDHWPEYLSDTLSTHPENPFYTLRAKFIFEKNGRQSLVKNLSSIPFSTSSGDELVFEGDITKKSWSELNKHFQVAAYKGDTALMYEIINELYFNRRNRRTNWIAEFEPAHMAQYLEDSRLGGLMDMVKADKKRMKDNVIRFLEKQSDSDRVWLETQ